MTHININEALQASVRGDVALYEQDAAGNRYPLLEKRNAIHPQNLARLFARALANEGNASIFRIAFGNGGSYRDSVGNIIVKPANDGQGHDAAAAWASRLYNETYSEVVDDSSPDIGRDLGSAANENIRAGGGARPENDPEGATSVVSRELGLISQAIVTAYINPSEPGGQLITQSQNSTVDQSFYFDEIGLYTSGRQNIATFAYQNIAVNDAVSTDNTGLIRGSQYVLQITVSGVTRRFVVRVPLSGGDEVTYGEMCEGLNNGSWVESHTATGPNASQVTESSLVTENDYGIRVAVTDSSGQYPTIIGEQTNGFLRFMTQRVGKDATIAVTFSPSDLTNSSLLNALTGGDDDAVLDPVVGTDPGVQSDAADASNEIERLIAHLTFNPIQKSADRIIVVEYTLTVAFPRSPSVAIATTNVTTTAAPLP